MTNWKRSLIATVLLLLATTVASADQLQLKLAELDGLRAGLATDYAEVVRRGEELLEKYSQPAERARIYHMMAFVDAQSFLQHPDQVIVFAKAALALPLDPIKRLQLYVFWGNALEVKNRGVRGDALAAVRPTVAAPYLQGIVESGRQLAEVRDMAIPVHEETPERDGHFDKDRFNAHARASSERNLRLAEIEQYQRSCEKQIAFLYSRRPFATAEITELVDKSIPDKAVRDRLLAAVRSQISKRSELTK